MKKIAFTLALGLMTVFFLSLTSVSSFALDTAVVGQPYYGYGGGYDGYGPDGGFYAVPYPPYYSSNPALQRPISLGNPFYLNRYIGRNLRPAREILFAPNPINNGYSY